MAAQQSSQQAALQRDVDALIAQLRDLGVCGAPDKLDPAFILYF